MHQFPALATADPKNIRWIFICGGLLIGLVLLGFFALTAFKRWMSDTTDVDAPGFGLSDMRRLRDEGKISAEEYELTRAKMMAAAKRMTAEVPDIIPRQTPRSTRQDPDPSDPPSPAG